MKGTDLEQIKTHADEVIAGEISLVVNEEQEKELYFLLGGLDALNTVASNMNAAVIINLQRIRDEKLYLSSKFKTFEDFMDGHPKSTMSYKRFNYVEGVFKNLGHQVFDLLNGSGLSMRQQKLLGKGNVEIIGDKVIVHRDDETTEVEINNRREWLESLRILADANAEKAIKLERQKEKIDRHDEKVREIYQDMDRIKAAKVAEVASNPHMIARVELGLAFTRLAEAASKLSAIEKEQFRDSVLQDVAEWRLALASGYATDSSKTSAPVTIVGESLDDALENYLDNVDLDNVADDNDGDLAAAL